jgi:predicted TIM-barrel fold metal-dependent hydrolase
MYDIEPEQMFDESAACAKLSGNEFIFDIQTHFFEHGGDWTPSNIPNYVSWEQTNPGYVTILSRLAGANYGMTNYLDVLFCQSDTKMAVLSCWPGALCTAAAEMLFGANPPCGLPMSTEGAAEARDFINKMANSQRLLSHAMILPNDPAGVEVQLEIMERTRCTTGVGAWKLYPAWGPGGTGFFINDPDIGIPVIEKGIALGVPNFCIHKGLPIPGFDSEHNVPVEIGPLAKAYPNGNFIIYHSSINANGSTHEGPYVDGDTKGVNALITSMIQNGIGPNENVFGELGSSWRQVMNDATQAAHYLGKLLKYVGEHNILWGTDCMVGGTPQMQIEALRAATIPKELQDQYGYPELTADIKAKIFGLNSAVVYGVDPEKRHCQIEKCAVTTFKQQIDEEMGKRRWTLSTPPSGPRTYEEYVEQGKRAIARGIPG